jgi:RNA polymerase sigma-70 factor (ECF subfamily)
MGAESTQASLLSRVRDASDDGAWREFDAKYRELILRYSRARGLQPADAEDVRQIAMLLLAKSLRTFEYSAAKGKFRYYLGQVVRSAISRQFRRPEIRARALDSGVRATVDAGDSGANDELWEQEWVRHHYRLAMETVRKTFEPQSIQMFDRLLAGDGVEKVAANFASTTQAVHKVKQRIRNRLTELITAQVRAEDEPDA